MKKRKMGNKRIEFIKVEKLTNRVKFNGKLALKNCQLIRKHAAAVNLLTYLYANTHFLLSVYLICTLAET